MIRLADAALTGLWAALSVPRWLRGTRLTSLMHPPAVWEAGAAPARGSVRAAHAAVRVLAGVPLLPWRNTCLYRSVAECLVLRRYGVPAVVRIGVKNEAPPHGPIAAHAWVVRADDPAEPAQGPGAHHPLAVRA
ncbi:MAG TPA: lasso peptide biosynthesis B2 protein [Longimicrobium sp.]|nr:lasso peptide biosynthesis B2 protein [Longimicrobium sp.]